MKILYVLILVLIFYGCAATGKKAFVFEGKNLFVQERNYDVGRSIEVAPLEPSKISSHNQDQDEYLFEWKTGCKFVYYVNKKTKIVESWEYVSSPDKCTMGFNWFEPW